MANSQSDGREGNEAALAAATQESETADPKFLAELDQLNSLFGDPRLDARQLWNGLLGIAYARLYRIAARLIGSPHGTPTLGATALINEGYCRLLQSSDLEGIRDAEHFYRRFAVSMKHALVDYARGKLSEKRGGDRQRADLELVLQWFALPTNQFLDLTDALEELATDDPPCGRLMELRYFGQMSIGELSALTGMSTATIERRIRFGKAYLRAKLSDEGHLEEHLVRSPFQSSD